MARDARVLKRALWRNLLLSLGVFTVTLLAVGVAGEYAVRRRERTRESAPGSMPFLFYRHSRFGHALVRSNDYFGWVHVNSLGFRGGEVAQPKPQGIVRIVAMGGSTTFDTFVSADDRTWPARMEHWLKQLAPDARVEVINAGVPGYRIADDFLRLQTDIAPLHPDVIVQLHGHNDLNSTIGSAGALPTTEQRPNEVSSSLPGIRWLERHSLLYTKVAARFAAMGWGRKSRPRASVTRWLPAIDSGAKRFEREMSAFVMSARMIGARVVLTEAVHAAGTKHRQDSTVLRYWRNTLRSPLDTTLFAYEQFNAATRRSATGFGAVLATATEWGIEGAEYYAPDDPIHFNDAGADLMGRRMAEFIIRAGVLSPAPAQPTGSPASARPRADSAARGR